LARKEADRRVREDFVAELDLERRARLVERERFEKKFAEQEARFRAMESKIAETMLMAEQVRACQFMRGEGNVESPFLVDSEADDEVVSLGVGL
jgi:hypothetical protein